MNQEPRKNIVTAYHEAGHAVGAYFLGVRFDHVSIDDTNDGHGSVLGLMTIAEIRRLSLAWENAVVAMLGREAEQVFFGHAERRYLGSDARTIAGLYLTFFEDQMSCQLFRAELRSRTAKVVGRPGFREAVDALACVVRVEKVVPQSRAIAVIRSVTTAGS